MNRCGAGDFANFLLPGQNLCAGREMLRTLGEESGELAVYRSTRADALDDLLPYITALVKVQRLRLFGFLRQITLTDIDTIPGTAGHDAPHFQSFKPHGACARRRQS